jgi:hypothetical protein
MSQDPSSEYNPNPANPGGPQSPQNPYETPSQNSYDMPSYQVPPQPPHGAYQEFPPYASVPPPNAYSAPGYAPHQASYAFESSSPLPLGAAISQLPQQYFRVLTKPSQFTFAVEMGKASWNIVWVQLLAYAIITGIMTCIQVFMVAPIIDDAVRGQGYYVQYDVLQTILPMAIIGIIIIVPISIFMGQGITYLLAKAFGGSGTFLRQCYTYLLITVPVGITSSILGLIPSLGNLAVFGLGIYAIILQIFSLMSVHRISGGKATAVVLIPIAVAVVLAIVLIVVLVVAIISAVPHTPYPPSLP